jgi:hypothetical protein
LILYHAVSISRWQRVGHARHLSRSRACPAFRELGGISSKIGFAEAGKGREQYE